MISSFARASKILKSEAGSAMFNFPVVGSDVRSLLFWLMLGNVNYLNELHYVLYLDEGAPPCLA